MNNTEKIMAIIKDVEYEKEGSMHLKAVEGEENIIIKALEKQIPKKPTKDSIPYCPHCNKVFVTSNEDYCHRCGGKIDWTDTK
ncbi:MAG TPA: hypothetical protein VN258_06500 [Mobilitalea sp.]|nr:hypothetical protein [Mobilitalea sp.]